jgi:hypothetical protein
MNFQSEAERFDVDGAREFVHKPMDLDEYKTAVSGMVQKWTGHYGAASYPPCVE